MKITIVGGGNIGTQLAVHFSEKGNEVTIYTTQPELFTDELYILNEKNEVIHKAKKVKATSNPKEAFSCAELIMITLPPNVINSVSELIYQNADKSAFIGVVPGNGGGECDFKKCIERGNVFFGMERVPAIARLIEKGRSVRCIGYRDELHISSLPKKNIDVCCELIYNLLDIPCNPIPNYLNLTLTPSNPILHTSRLKTLFQDWKKGDTYASIPLFYEEWDDASSELLLKCDDEVQEICSAFPEIELEYVKSLKEHYESYTVSDMTRKISSIPAFKGIATPSIKVNDGYIPDLNSRYFMADFSYGLCIIKQVALFAKVQTPYIDSVLEWYNNLSCGKGGFDYNDYGIVDKDSFLKFYCQ